MIGPLPATGAVRRILRSAPGNAMSRMSGQLRATLLVTVALTVSLVACGERDDPSVPSAATGARLAQSLGCAACHSADGARKLGPTWDGLWGETVALTDGTTVVVDAGYIARSIREPAAQVVRGFAPLMPQVALSDADIDAIVAYIRSLANQR